MKQNLSERIVSFLEKENRDVKRIDVEKIALKHEYSKEHFYHALAVIADTYANIGQWQDQQTKTNYLRWYQPNDLTRAVQKCLGRGDDW